MGERGAGRAGSAGAAVKEEKGQITRAASVVGLATAVSRVLGYIRDAVIAAIFGAGFHADAFFVAFRLSNLLRRLVGEGALTSAFVPIFTEELGKRTNEEASRLASRVFTLFFLILIFLAALGVVFAEPLVRLLAPGFADSSEKLALTVSLTRAMFPYMVFIGLVAIAMGVLNSMRHFFAPALSPVLFNLAIIASALVVSPFLKDPVYALALGVVIGGVLQLLFQLPYLARHGMLPRPDFSFSDPAIAKIFLLMGPAALGVGVYQLNIFVTMRFASELSEGSVAYLYYAARLTELPLGVFAVALSTAVLPSLSTFAASEDYTSLRESISFAMRSVIFVIIPATFGLIALSLPIIEVLFMRGEFGALAATETAYALYFYAAGLVPVACSRVLVTVFYSLKDTKTPLYAALASLVINIVMCMVLMGPLRHGGLALATSLSALANLAVLALVLGRRLRTLGGGPVDGGGGGVAMVALKCLVSSVAMTAVVYLLHTLSGWSGHGFMVKALLLGLYILIGVAVYGALCKALKVEELELLRGLIRKKGGAKTG